MGSKGCHALTHQLVFKRWHDGLINTSPENQSAGLDVLFLLLSIGSTRLPSGSPLGPIVAVCFSNQDLFTAVIVLLDLIMAHVVCAACLTEEIRIAPGGAARKKSMSGLFPMLDGGCNGGTRSGCICSEKEAEQQRIGPEAAEFSRLWRRAPGETQECPPLPLHSCLIQLLGPRRPSPSPSVGSLL